MKGIICGLVVCLMAAPAMAVMGLPYAETALVTAGEIGVSAGVTIQSDMNMYGGRASYGIMNGLSAFAGAGMVDPDMGDGAMYFQLGGKYQLPFELPVDLAARASFGMTSFDGSAYGYKWETDLWMLNGGVLASWRMDDMFSFYGFGGLSYQSVKSKSSGGPSFIPDDELTTSMSHSSSDSEIELAIAAGAIFSLSENLSFYGELAMIDEMFISAGARFAFGGM